MSGIDFTLNQFELIVAFIIQAAAVTGYALTGLGIYGFYRGTEFPQNHPMAKNIFMVLSGSMLIIAGSIYQGFDNTLFNQSESLDAGALYLDVNAAKSIVENGINAAIPTRGGLSSQLIPAETAALIIGFMYMIGVIAFVKGIFMLKDAGEFVSPQGDNKVSSAIVFMVSGVIAININDVGCMVGNTFGTTIFCAA
mgnify:CR=1 FL=1